MVSNAIHNAKVEAADATAAAVKTARAAEEAFRNRTKGFDKVMDILLDCERVADDHFATNAGTVIRDLMRSVCDIDRSRLQARSRAYYAKNR